jgi:hypothetical protein
LFHGLPLTWTVIPFSNLTPTPFFQKTGSMFGSKKIKRGDLLILLCLIGAAAITLAIEFCWNKNQKPIGASMVTLEDVVLPRGTRMPKIDAQGWLNGPPIPLGKGGAKVLVIDFWAYW